MPVHAEWYCKHCDPNNNGPGPGPVGPPVRKRGITWTYNEDFESGTPNDEWPPWTKTGDGTWDFQVDGDPPKKYGLVEFTADTYHKKLSWRGDIILEAHYSAQQVLDVMGGLYFRKTSTLQDRIEIWARIIANERKLRLCVASGTHTGYPVVFEWSEPDWPWKWYNVGTLEINANYETKKAKIKGLINSEIDIGDQITGSTTRVLCTREVGAEGSIIGVDAISLATSV